jgi:hypothetical protein
VIKAGCGYESFPIPLLEFIHSHTHTIFISIPKQPELSNMNGAPALTEKNNRTCRIMSFSEYVGSPTVLNKSTQTLLRPHLYQVMYTSVAPLHKNQEEVKHHCTKRISSYRYFLSTVVLSPTNSTGICLRGGIVRGELSQGSHRNTQKILLYLPVWEIEHNGETSHCESWISISL